MGIGDRHRTMIVDNHHPRFTLPLV